MFLCLNICFRLNNRKYDREINPCHTIKFDYLPEGKLVGVGVGFTFIVELVVVGWLAI